MTGAELAMTDSLTNNAWQVEAHLEYLDRAGGVIERTSHHWVQMRKESINLFLRIDDLDHQWQVSRTRIPSNGRTGQIGQDDLKNLQKATNVLSPLFHEGP